MRILLVGLVVVLLTVMLGVGCGPTPEEEQYREAFNSGVDYLKQGKEYLSDAETLVRVGNLDEAALAASRAQGKFGSAASRFHEAYQIATEHGIGVDTRELPQQQGTPTSTPTTIQLGRLQPGMALEVKIIEADAANSKAWNNWRLSLELESQSGELVDRIVEAKQEMAQRASILDFIGILLSLLPLLL